MRRATVRPRPRGRRARGRRRKAGRSCVATASKTLSAVSRSGLEVQHGWKAVVVVGVGNFWDELWEDAPDPLPGFDVELRRSFLLAHLRAGDGVLDLGCGEGDFAAAAAQAGAADVVGVDIA